MQLTERIKQAGIIGCGGAGFPTHAKYSSSQIRTILLNGAECEPLLQTDRYLMRNHAKELIRAADMLLQETGAESCIVALKRSYTRETAALEAAILEAASPIRLQLLDSFFPAGDEQTIVYETTGQVVPPAGIPLDVGCVVTNIATLYAIAGAMEDRPFTQKYLTVTGEVDHPIIARVPVGTPVSECLKLAGGTRISDYIVVDGGPMMGRVMTKEEAEQAYVTKTVSGLIILPAGSSVAVRTTIPWERMANRAKSACIQCTFCTQLCPRALLGHPLKPHRIMRKLSMGRPIAELLEDQDIQNAALCCSCGVCEIYACPMGLQPRTVNTVLKRELARQGIRWSRPEGPWEALPERSMRKAPTERIAARAGVSPYEYIQIDELREISPETAKSVCISLRQGIGAPAIPLVKNGEEVKNGQLIAVPPEGKLGSFLHASISGTVQIKEQYIEIREQCRR